MQNQKRGKNKRTGKSNRTRKSKRTGERKRQGKSVDGEWRGQRRRTRSALMARLVIMAVEDIGIAAPYAVFIAAAAQSLILTLPDDPTSEGVARASKPL